MQFELRVSAWASSNGNAETKPYRLRPRCPAGLLRETIESHRFPLSPRIWELRAIVAKLDPPRPAPCALRAGEALGQQQHRPAEEATMSGGRVFEGRPRID
jgi:hypothetical protein